jgi:hypothetical protein
MGATTAAAAFHIISGEQASTITSSVTQISDGLAQIAAGLAPLIAIATGLYATWTASPKSQIAAVNSNPTNGVKVVADTAAAPQVNSPIIPPVAKS